MNQFKKTTPFVFLIFFGITTVNYIYQNTYSNNVAFSTGIGWSELIKEAVNTSQNEQEEIKKKVHKLESIIKSKQGDNEKELEMDRPIKEMIVQFNLGDSKKLITDEQFQVFSSNADMAMRSVLDDEFNLSDWEGVKLYDQILVTVDLSDDLKSIYDEYIIKGNVTDFLGFRTPELEPFKNLINELAVEHDVDSYVAALFTNCYSVSSSGDTSICTGQSFIGDMPSVENGDGEIAAGVITLNPDLAYDDTDISAVPVENFILLARIAFHEGILGHSARGEHTCHPSVMGSSNLGNCTDYVSFLDYITRTGEYFDNEEKKNRDIILEELKDKGYIREAISSSVTNIQDENISIFPSIIQNSFSIENNGLSIILDKSLYNINGTKIKDLNNEETRYDVSYLPKGLYFLNIVIKSDGKIKKGTIKLIKQ